MKKLFFVLVAAMGLSMTSYAQANDKEMKKAVKAAQKIVKDARNEMEREDIVDKRGAKRLIDQAMKNDLIQDWDQTWYEAAQIYYHFYLQENNKSYRQGTPYDTVGMYNYLSKFIEFAVRADSLQQIPDAKGKTKNEARTALKPDIIRNVNTFINGGIFYFNNRSDYQQAYNMFDKYFSLAQLDLIKEDMANDETYKQYKTNFSYFPALAAYNLEQWENSLKYALIAMDDEEYGETATEFACESYGALGDTVKWLETLKKGLVKYPTVDYYYSKLLNYYNSKDNMNDLEEFIKEMIKVDPSKAYNYYVLGYIAYQNKDYDKAIEQYKLAIEKDPSLADAYNNLGLCYMQQAAIYDQENSKVDYRTAKGKEVQAKIKEYYQQALPYYVKMRELAPTEVSKWGLSLQGIYYLLKMQPELNEIEKVLKENNLM